MNTGRMNNTPNDSRLYELTRIEMERAAGGKRPSQTDGIVDFFIWAACGFNHHYVPTGKVRTEIDLVFPVKFYQVKCRDCGHKTWKRMEKNEAYVQGPQIGPDGYNPQN